jgi:hypothetical protein
VPTPRITQGGSTRPRALGTWSDPHCVLVWAEQLSQPGGGHKDKCSPGTLGTRRCQWPDLWGEQKSAYGARGPEAVCSSDLQAPGQYVSIPNQPQPQAALGNLPFHHLHGSPLPSLSCPLTSPLQLLPECRTHPPAHFGVRETLDTQPSPFQPVTPEEVQAADHEDDPQAFPGTDHLQVTHMSESPKVQSQKKGQAPPVPCTSTGGQALEGEELVTRYRACHVNHALHSHSSERHSLCTQWRSLSVEESPLRSGESMSSAQNGHQQPCVTGGEIRAHAGASGQHLSCACLSAVHPLSGT